jgi:guanine deaminase
VVLDLKATPLLARRTAKAQSLADTLHMLGVLADDRVVERTYLAGRLAHARDRA